MAVPKNMKAELPCDPAIPFLGMHITESKSGSQTDTCTSMFVAALFTYPSVPKLHSNIQL
jgi:hypothetical protein